MLRIKGLEPPKSHVVGPFLLQLRDRFPKHRDTELEEAAAISRRLRKDREIAFYGDVDLIPTEIYGKAEASQAIQGADRILAMMGKHISGIRRMRHIRFVSA